MMFTCYRCQQTKERSLFSVIGGRAGYVCKACRAAIKRARYWANPERYRAESRAYKMANPDKVREGWARWSAPRRQELSDRACRQMKENPALNRLRRSLRRAAERCPPWADRMKILEFYERAARLSACTGIPHHVDHIYPVRSKVGCGLHVETNLQILPAVINQRKSNSVPVAIAADQPRCCAWPSIVHFDGWMRTQGV